MRILKRKTAKNKSRIDYAKKFYETIDDLYQQSVQALTMISSEELDKGFYIHLPEDFYTPFMKVEELMKSREFMDTIWYAYQSSKDDAEIHRTITYGLKNCKKLKERLKSISISQEFRFDADKIINDWKFIDKYRGEIDKMEEIFDFIDSDTLDDFMDEKGLDLEKFAPDFKFLNSADILNYLNGTPEDRDNMKKELSGTEKVLRKEHRKLKDISTYLQLRDSAVNTLMKYYETEIKWMNFLIEE